MSLISEILTQNNIINFSEQEVLNGYPEKNIPAILIPNIAPTLKLLQLIRNDIGKPIIIHSTYRDKNHNEECGGKPNSLHLSFNAIDFAPVDTSYSEMQQIKSKFLARTYVFHFDFKGTKYTVTPNLCGIGLYHTFIHIDTRGLLGRPSPAVWKG
jgi:hypothetical protein